MGRMRMILLFVGLGAVMAISPLPAADTVQDPNAAPTAKVGDDPMCSSCGVTKCPCACSPLAGAWVASFSSPTLTNVQTFKFTPVNQACTRFNVNSEATIRSAKVLKAWPDANDMTEFAGTACMNEEGRVEFTAIAYGIERRFDCRCNDRIAFIAIMSGTVEVPPKEECETSCTDAECGDRSVCTVCKCNEPNELPIRVNIAYFDASQDTDRDGFPDQCDAVICEKHETCLKRVRLMKPCESGDTFIARMMALKGVSSGATGRAFFTLMDDDTKVQFVVTVSTMKDITKAEILIAPKEGDPGQAAVLLFPIPPEKEKTGDFCGLLTCGTFTANDCFGPLKNKRIADLVKAINEGRATVVVSTKKHPNGEIGGKITDP